MGEPRQPEEPAEQAARRFDLRPLLPPVRDQGMRGTCLAFALTAAHEIARAGGKQVREDLSEAALYWGCKQIDGDTGSGSEWTSAAAALERWGQPPEEWWPYNGALEAEGAQPPAGAPDPGTGHHARLRPVDSSVEKIKREVHQGRAVALGLWLSRGFFAPVRGYIPFEGPADLIDEGHAVLVVGYDDGTAPESGVLIIRNSWGTEWGDAGYGYLPYAYLETGASAWVVEPEPAPG